MQLLPDRDCSTCTALQKTERGCEKNAPLPVMLDGHELWRCPRRPIYEKPAYFASVFQAYRSYMRGYLPDPGSLEEQGYRYTIAMMVIDSAVAEAQAEQDRRSKKS